jgi:hypothetical protein
VRKAGLPASIVGGAGVGNGVTVGRVCATLFIVACCVSADDEQAIKPNSDNNASEKICSHLNIKIDLSDVVYE